MMRPVIGIGLNGDFECGTAYVYHNEAWRECTAKIYDGTNWQLVGVAGTLLIPLYDSNNQLMYTSDDEMILVRKAPTSPANLVPISNTPDENEGE